LVRVMRLLRGGLAERERWETIVALNTRRGLLVIRLVAVLLRRRSDLALHDGVELRSDLRQRCRPEIRYEGLVGVEEEALKSQRGSGAIRPRDRGRERQLLLVLTPRSMPVG
jgi:hypothetical protein